MITTHCSDEPHLLDSMRYHTMHTSSSRCQDPRGHNSQRKHGPLSPNRRAYCSPRGRSTMRPPPTNHQSGDDNLEHSQTSPEHPATGAPGTPRAQLAVRPPLKPHQSSIRAMRTQLRTRNTKGIDGGAAATQSTVRYHRNILSQSSLFIFQDTALGQPLQKSRIVGLT